MLNVLWCACAHVMVCMCAWFNVTIDGHILIHCRTASYVHVHVHVAATCIHVHVQWNLAIPATPANVAGIVRWLDLRETSLIQPYYDTR